MKKEIRYIHIQKKEENKYMKNKPIVINLLGGPCTGKSTLAAELFSSLKKIGVECELVMEYAKDKVWEESFHTLDNQIYVFGKQLHRMWRLKDKVDVIVTDSPLLLSMLYDKKKSKTLRKLVIEQYNEFDNLTYFIKRNFEYNENGRYQTEKEAKDLDEKLLKMLNSVDIDFWVVNNDEETKNKIIDDVIYKLKNES